LALVAVDFTCPDIHCAIAHFGDNPVSAKRHTVSASDYERKPS